jgi:hypothetical protein
MRQKQEEDEMSREVSWVAGLVGAAAFAFLYVAPA